MTNCIVLVKQAVPAVFYMTLHRLRVSYKYVTEPSNGAKTVTVWFDISGSSRMSSHAMQLPKTNVIRIIVLITLIRLYFNTFL